MHRAGVGRVGVGRVGVGRVGVGYGRAGYGWGRGAGYRGYGLVSAAVSGTAVGSGYYASGGYGASAGYNAYTDYGTSGGDTYILHGTEISGSDAAAYCAQQFRSYDAESGTFLAYSGERVSCPQQ
ncbi:MAG: BA14K family protein [Alphaproteobacteria bacterium]|nr:MAG: BA14K family protein [Alphaproteobacteria bacterium]